jgi:methyl-accepting chemotaxis protein
LLERTFDQLISLRLEKKNRIEQFFLDRNRDISLISGSEEVSKIVADLNSGSENVNELPKAFSSYLSNYISAYGYYRKLRIVGTQKRGIEIIAEATISGEKVPNSDYLIQEELIRFCDATRLAGKTIIRDLSESQLLIYIGDPVYDNREEVTGCIALEIPITAINKIMFGHSEKNGLGETGETCLVGSDHLMRSNSRIRENAVLNIKVNSDAAKSAIAGITGTDIIRDYRNIPCLSSYSSVNIGGLNWVILAEIDEQEAMIPVYRIRNSILLIVINWITRVKVTEEVELAGLDAGIHGETAYDVGVL